MAQQAALQRMAEALTRRFPVFTTYEILKFQEEFSTYDEDGSGDIDHREIAKLFNALGEPIPKKACQAVIAQFDKDGEGSIDFEEFVDMMYQLKTGKVDASDGFLRAYILQQATYEQILDMLRTSSTNLTDLSLANQRSRGQDGRLYEGLKANSMLVSLNLENCGLQAEHATRIGEALLDNSKLVQLNLSCNAIQDEGFEHVAAALCMPPDARAAWEQVQDATDELADLRDEYRLVNRQYNEYLEQLRRENRILTQQGNLDSILFRDSAAQAHFNAIRRQNEELLGELEHAALRKQDALEYYSQQKGNVFVERLLCRSCYLYDRSGHLMARTIQWNRTLKTVVLAGNAIGSAGIQALASALHWHVSLRHLDISGNVCGAEAGLALARMLSHNSVLTRADLADNSFSNAAAEGFSEMLGTNTTLLSLDLSGNLITAGPGKGLARAVAAQFDPAAKTRCLTQLVMMRNDISAEQQAEVQAVLGADWRYRKSTAGISCALRAMPDVKDALAALSDKQNAALESAFFAFDEDGSGTMDAEELHAAAEVMGLQMKKEDVDDMIKMIDADGSGEIDMAEFKGAMAVIIAVNAAEAAEEDEDGVEVVETEDEVVAELMFASGVYDPSHVFPEAMQTGDGGVHLGSLAALRTGYRILCQGDRNASLSHKHQAVIKRVLTFLGWDQTMLKRKMPYTARQLRSALANVPAVVETPVVVPGSQEDKLEQRLAAVETPEDDVSRLDQAILWLFRGVPLTMDQVEKAAENS